MLKVKNVDVSYGASQALYDVSMDAEVGKVTCVLGRNGVGKTTLMKALSGHLSAGKGEIKWRLTINILTHPFDLTLACR